MKTPECDRLIEVKQQYDLLVKFCAWLRDNNFAIVERDISDDIISKLGGQPTAVDRATIWLEHESRVSDDRLCAQYFNIDLGKVEDEMMVLLGNAES